MAEVNLTLNINENKEIKKDEDLYSFEQFGICLNKHQKTLKQLFVIDDSHKLKPNEIQDTKEIQYRNIRYIFYFNSLLVLNEL